MFAFTALLALASSALPAVLAHGGVLAYSNGGNWYQGWAPYNSPVGQTTIQRPWSTYNPIQDATDPTIACNDDGTSGALQLTATVKAGSAITAYWNQVWPHAIGPMLTYLAQCPGSTCTGVNANTLKWFKIDEAGLLSGTVYDGQWAAGQMIAQNSSWTTTIPSTVPSGNYLIRFETIALHSMPAVRVASFSAQDIRLRLACSNSTLSVPRSRSPVAATLLRPLLSSFPSPARTATTTRV